jgi:hypothetical protein
MQTPIGASRATSTGLFVYEEWVFFNLRHWYNVVYADTRYVQRHGNIVSKRYPTKQPVDCPVSLAAKLSR